MKLIAEKTWKMQAFNNTPDQQSSGIAWNGDQSTTSNDLSVRLTLATIKYSEEDSYRFSASYDFGLTQKEVSYEDACYPFDVSQIGDPENQKLLISGDGTRTIILTPESGSCSADSYLITY
jgi:hypothetical protein